MATLPTVAKTPLPRSLRIESTERSAQLREEAIGTHGKDVSKDEDPLRRA